MGLKGKVRFACLATLALTLTFSLTTTTALADQAAPRSDNPNAYKPIALHKSGVLVDAADNPSVKGVWEDAVVKYLKAYYAGDGEQQQNLNSWWSGFFRNGNGQINHSTYTVTKQPIAATETEFDFTCTVTVGGQPVPFSYVVADAESLATEGNATQALNYGAASGGTLEKPSRSSNYYNRKEWLDVTASGATARWHISEHYTGCGSSQQVTMLNDEKKLRLHNQEHQGGR